MSKSKLSFRIRRRLRTWLWQVQSLCASDRLATFTLPDGSRFDYPRGSAIGCALYNDDFETAEVSFVRQSLRPGQVFLDIGANGGLFTVIAARCVGPHGHVYAFEPGTRELELLRHNLAVNNLTNVTIINRAVSNRSGTAQFAVSADGAMNSLARTSHPHQRITHWEKVATVTLDDFVREFNLPQVDFIKIDVEGAERQVFAGAAELLASRRLTVLFEASDLNSGGFGYSVCDFLAELADSGLSVCSLARDGRLIELSEDSRAFSRNDYSFVAVTQPVVAGQNYGTY